MTILSPPDNWVKRACLIVSPRSLGEADQNEMTPQKMTLFPDAKSRQRQSRYVMMLVTYRLISAMAKLPTVPRFFRRHIFIEAIKAATGAALLCLLF
jgi:hypothetical protein